MRIFPSNEWLAGHPELWFVIGVVGAWIGAGAIKTAMESQTYPFEFELMVTGTLVGTIIPMAVAVKLLDWSSYVGGNSE